MKIFLLEKPILDKIEAVVDKYFADQGIIPVPKILYLDYEPDDGYIHDVNYDGAVCVYARTINFPPGTGSNTGTQDSNAFLTIDAYGFGDPLPVEADPTKYEPAVRISQKRAQNLTTLAYKAIMDRIEIVGLPNASPAVLKSYGTDIDIDSKYPQSITKYSPQGTMNSRRGVCMYRSEYDFKIGEDVPAETLGPDYAGPETWEIPTKNPG